MKKRFVTLSLAVLLSVVSTVSMAPTVEAKPKCINPGGQQVGGAAPENNPHCTR
jgi:hypothetical protein